MTGWRTKWEGDCVMMTVSVRGALAWERHLVIRAGLGWGIYCGFFMSDTVEVKQGTALPGVKCNVCTRAASPSPTLHF
jgi:hypothetical protein